MADTDDWGGVAVNPEPKADDWGGIPVAAPKIPDTSGVQNMAHDNLAANDNKETEGEPKPPQTPAERLNTAAGFPVDKVINGTATPTDFNTEHRAQYVKALNNGSAVSSSDWLPTLLHSIVPIVAGAVQRTEHPINSAEDVAGATLSTLAKGETHILTSTPASLTSDVLQGTLNLPVQGLTRLAGAAYEGLGGEMSLPVAKAFTQGIPEFGGIEGQKEIREAINKEINYEPKTQAGKIAESATGIAPYLLGGEASLVRKGLGAVLSGAGTVIGGESGTTEKSQQVGSILGGAPGMIFGASNAAKPTIKGPWDNLPGHDIIRPGIAKQLDKAPHQVTSPDTDNVIAQGSKDVFPPDKDFKAVSKVTGIPESSLQIVFKETGVKPDQIFADAQRNPEIATEVAAGKVPEEYEHLVEERPILPPIQAEKLSVAHDEVTRSYNVVDKDGDHVRGGFDSAEEAKHYIEDEKFKAEERQAIEEGGKSKPITEGDQSVIPGAEKISDKSLVERIMNKVLRSDKEQKAANEGLFNEVARNQEELFSSKPKISGTIPPSEIGKPTSLRTFLSNNGAKFNENNELVSIKKNGEHIKGAGALEHANEIAKEHGYLANDKNETDLANALTEKNGGREVWREADADRVAKAREAKQARESNDPDKIEHQAHALGLDTEVIKDETPKQRSARLLDAVKEFYKAQEGSGITLRAMIGDTITAAEKFAGKLAGGFFEKLGDAYIKTFQPELVGPLAKRADAFLAKYKTSLQEAENAFYREHAAEKSRWDKKSSNERMEWLYDHETGRWNEEDDPDHARYQALLDATFKTEKEAIGADVEKGYKENYLPHAWENPDAVKKYFNSDAYIKKYGKDGFTKRSAFQLIQDGIRAGFKLKTDNPESMLTARLLAGNNMIRTMDLLRDMEGSGLATRSTSFGIDKKIAQTEAAISDLTEKYKKEFEKANNPDQKRAENVAPAVSKTMQLVEKRLADLNTRLEDFRKEKEANKLTPEQMKDLKGGFRIIGPDSHAWNVHQEVGPLWKNAMEMKGLWERDGLTGDAYRSYIQGKAIWTQVKLGLSLFHPIHVAMINLASHIAAAADNLIQGGKLSELALRDSGITMGLTKETLSGVKGFLKDNSSTPNLDLRSQDHPALQAWNAAPEARTPEQKQIVSRMLEGGFKPTMSARDTVHFKENFDKAIAGVGLNNLRLIGTAISLPGVIMKPFFEHWIPGMKSEIYLKRYQAALDRDPSLINDAGKRGEVARQIAKDTDRTYGEMNNDVQFWNKNVRDSFNAAFISGGWKLAQIYNARGLLEPGKIAYKFAKTGEFSKADITYNMLHAYTYTALTLALGGAINAMLGNPIGTAKDTVWDMVKNLVAPQTGEKNPDGTPIRLNQPAFAKEAYNLAHEINTKGLLGGSGSFLYHQTLLPGIVDTLNNRDFTGRELISDPTDLNQWMNAGWESVSPISIAQYEKAEQKHSEVGKIAGLLGFPTAGAYLNQTPFEQKVLYTYDQQNPPKGDEYSQKLKADLKSSIASGDLEKVDHIKAEMKREGMTVNQISAAEKPYTKKFVEQAWKELPAQDQKRLIESASDEEVKKFKVKHK